MALIPKVGRNTFKIRFLLIGITVFLWLGIALHLFPVWWMLSTSLKSTFESYRFPPTLWPKKPTLSSYKLIFYLGGGQFSTSGGYGLRFPFYIYLKNSLIITGAIMAIQIPVCALLGYSLSKLYTPRWSRIIFLYSIGTMMLAGQLALIPTYLLIYHFPFPTMNIPKIPFTNIPFPTHNFLNSYWAVIIPGMYSAFNVLLFKGFFDTIPDELINAARLDGSSEIGIMRRIIIPLSKPIFAVVAYFTFSGAWNNFMWPLIVLTNDKKWTLPVILYEFQKELTNVQPVRPEERSLYSPVSYAGYNSLMALAIVESIPVFIMFLIFRKYLMTGIKLRGFK